MQSASVTSVSEPSGSAPQSGTRVRKYFIEGAKGALALAIEGLNIAASLTENVPYLGAISSVLTKIMALHDAVELFKTEWQAAMDDVRAIQLILDEWMESRDRTTLESCRSKVKALETTLFNALKTLNTCEATSTSLRHKAHMYRRHAELEAAVKKTRQDIQRALELFQTGIALDLSSKVDSIGADVGEIRLILTSDAHTQPEEDAVRGGALAPQTLPAAPAVFHGRQIETEHIVDLILHKAPARIAILGPGGMGKTAIALAVLYHPYILGAYPQHRFFVSCDAFISAKELVLGVLKALGMTLNHPTERSPIDLLLSSIGSAPVVLCLDNLESPWDADCTPVEALLARLAGIPSLTLLMTARGTHRPLDVRWSQPLLPPIRPITLDAALRTWDDICGSHDDHSLKLVEAVGCIPLAIILLAHLAESESSEALWARWNTEGTALLSRSHGVQDRLSSVPVSIELSLKSPRLAAEPDAIHFISLVCALPQGLPEARISIFEEKLIEDIPRMRRCITLLKQCSLIYSDNNSLRVLPTIREHINARYPLATALRRHLTDIYCALISDNMPDTESARRTFLTETVAPELDNIRHVLTLSLSDDPPPRAQDRLLWAIMDLTWAFGELSLDSYELLAKGTDFARRHDLRLYPQLLRQLAQYHLFDKVHHACTLFFCAFLEDNAHEDLHGMAEDAHGVAIALVRLGHPRHAANLLRCACVAHALVEDTVGQAYDFKALAVAYGLCDDAQATQDALQKARELHEKVGDRIGQANNLNSLGVIHCHLGHVSQAEQALMSALKLHEEAGAELSQANDLYTLADLYARCDRLSDAEEAAQGALELHRKVSDRLGQANDLRLIGELHRQRDRFEDAERSLRTALHLASEIGDLLGQAAAHADLRGLYSELGRTVEAEREYERQVALAPNDQLVGFRAGLTLDLKLLGKLYFRVGRLTSARSAMVLAGFIVREWTDQAAGATESQAAEGRDVEDVEDEGSDTSIYLDESAIVDTWADRR